MYDIFFISLWSLCANYIEIFYINEVASTIVVGRPQLLILTLKIFRIKEFYIEVLSFNLTQIVLYIQKPLYAIRRKLLHLIKANSKVWNNLFKVHILCNYCSFIELLMTFHIKAAKAKIYMWNKCSIQLLKKCHLK